MGRLLYIGEKIEIPTNGGDQVNRRNMVVLEKIYGANFIVYSLKRVSRLVTFLNILLRNVGLVRQCDYRKIKHLIRRNQVDTVFLWSSKLGKLARYLKKYFPTLRVVVFFHNVECQYADEELRIRKSAKTRLVASMVRWNESLATKWADVLIALNQRDSRLIDQIYRRKVDVILPTSFADYYDAEKGKAYKPMQSGVCRLLFVGYNFFANTQGIAWFIKEVLPRLPKVHLTIVGKNMDRTFASSEQVEVHGFVEDLSEFYYRTDIVVLPILSGGGMKTKTAEALMYGCAIVGTSEAFEGYDIDTSRVGGLADDAETMIQMIEYLCHNPSQILAAKVYAREVFVAKFTLQASMNILKAKLNDEK